MKFLKFIVILMGILIFLGVTGIIYVVSDKLSSKDVFNDDKNLNINNIYLNEGSKIINSNILDDKLILTIKLDNTYKIIIYDLKRNKKIKVINIK
tara:strand:- start:153 stop:437 length:285 start_codon:yes stop_codon:yes gene_type:complete